MKTQYISILKLFNLSASVSPVLKSKPYPKTKSESDFKPSLPFCICTCTSLILAHKIVITDSQAIAVIHAHAGS